MAVKSKKQLPASPPESKAGIKVGYKAGDKVGNKPTDKVADKNALIVTDVKVKTTNGREVSSVLSAEQKKRIVKQKQKARKASKVPHTVQESIPYEEMFKDGICRVNDHFYTKCIRFGDINYQLAQNEDKTAVFEYWCDFYNYFDSSISLQLSCMSQYANVKEMEGSIDIPPQEDEFNAIRREYDGVLKTQLAKGNNGLLRKKYVTLR